MDAARWAVIKESMNEEKFDSPDQYETSPPFSDAERAALDYVTELTNDKKIRQDQTCSATWDRLQ
jgi:hypothetical protein